MKTRRPTSPTKCNDQQSETKTIVGHDDDDDDIIFDNTSTSFVRLIGHGMKIDLARGDRESRSMKPVVQEEQRGGCLPPKDEETSAAPPPERGGGTPSSHSPVKSSTEVCSVPA